MKNYAVNFKKEHGIMFHHFHKQKKFPKSPGSINIKEFDKILKYVGLENIISANEFYERRLKNTLKKNHVCLTFDDGLKSQMIILEKLKKYSIKAFFFINTKYIDNNNISPELIRYFIYVHCKGMKEFYKIFSINCNVNLKNFFKTRKNEIRRYKLKYKFYSIEDIKYRILRNNLSVTKFNSILNKIMTLKSFNKKKILNNLYMSKKDLNRINKLGHIIGLHSHSHPMKISKLSVKEQKKEFTINKMILQRILADKKEINTMSYPTGDYSNKTQKILKNLNINIGFSNILSKKNKSNLDICRVNHKYILQNL